MKSIQMGNSGSAPKMSAQDYTTMLKRRVVSKSIDQSPQPAHRRYNYVPLLVQGNRADQVVKLVRDPTKSCNLPYDPNQAGWTDASRCCYNPFQFIVDFQGAPCSCNLPDGFGCPGPNNLPKLPAPTNTIKFTFQNTYSPTTNNLQFYKFFPTYYDFTGAIVTINGVPANIVIPAPGFMVVVDPVSSGDTVVLNLPNTIDNIDAVCWNFGP